MNDNITSYNNCYCNICEQEITHDQGEIHKNGEMPKYCESIYLLPDNCKEKEKKTVNDNITYGYVCEQQITRDQWQKHINGEMHKINESRKQSSFPQIRLNYNPKEEAKPVKKGDQRIKKIKDDDQITNKIRDVLGPIPSSMNPYGFDEMYKSTMDDKFTCKFPKPMWRRQQIIHAAKRKTPDNGLEELIKRKPTRPSKLILKSPKEENPLSSIPDTPLPSPLSPIPDTSSCDRSQSDAEYGSLQNEWPRIIYVN